MQTILYDNYNGNYPPFELHYKAEITGRIPDNELITSYERDLILDIVLTTMGYSHKVRMLDHYF